MNIEKIRQELNALMSEIHRCAVTDQDTEIKNWLMDAGKKFIAITDDPEERLAKYPEEERERRKARWSPTENVSLPFCIYMVEEV